MACTQVASRSAPVSHQRDIWQLEWVHQTTGKVQLDRCDRREMTASPGKWPRCRCQWLSRALVPPSLALWLLLGSSGFLWIFWSLHCEHLPMPMRRGNYLPNDLIGSDTVRRDNLSYASSSHQLINNRTVSHHYHPSIHLVSHHPPFHDPSTTLPSFHPPLSLSISSLSNPKGIPRTPFPPPPRLLQMNGRVFNYLEETSNLKRHSPNIPKTNWTSWKYSPPPPQKKSSSAIPNNPCQVETILTTLEELLIPHHVQSSWQIQSNAKLYGGSFTRIFKARTIISFVLFIYLFFLCDSNL